MSKDKIIVFQDTKCLVNYEQYADNDRPMLWLEDLEDEDDSYYCDATVNIPEIELAEDEVLIQLNNGNTGIVEALVSGGIISEPHRFENHNYYKNIPVAKLIK